MIVRTTSVALVHGADSAAKKGIFVVLNEHIILLFFQGLRIAIPAILLLMIPADSVKKPPFNRCQIG